MQSSFLGPDESADIAGSRLCAARNGYYYIHLSKPYSGASMELWHILATMKELEIFKRPVFGVELRSIDPYGIRLTEMHGSLVLSLLSRDTDSLQFYFLDIDSATALPVMLRGSKISHRINYSMIHIACQRILLVGGSSPTGVYYSSLFVLDFATGESRKMRPLTHGLDGFTLTHLGPGRVGLFGGYSKISCENMIYLVNKDQWSAVCPNDEVDELVAKRWKPCLHNLTDTLILIFGGYNGRVLNDLYVYSTSSNAYATIYPRVTSPLAPREDGAYILTKDKANLVLIGGGTKRCDVLDIETLRTSAMAILADALLKRDLTGQQLGAPQLVSSEHHTAEEKDSVGSRIVDEIKAKVAASGQTTELLDIVWPKKR